MHAHIIVWIITYIIVLWIYVKYMLVWCICFYRSLYLDAATICVCVWDVFFFLCLYLGVLPVYVSMYWHFKIPRLNLSNISITGMYLPAQTYHEASLIFSLFVPNPTGFVLKSIEKILFHAKSQFPSQVWWPMLVILALVRGRETEQ